MINLQDKSILITGGTGSFGKAFVKSVIDSKITPKRLIIYSRDELKQFEMNQIFSQDEHKFIRYFIGDVRDKSRVETALPKAEQNFGAANLIDCVDSDDAPPSGKEVAVTVMPEVNVT